MSRVIPYGLCICLLATAAGATFAGATFAGATSAGATGASADASAETSAAIEGRVVGGGGLAVEHARVAATGREVFTDSRGYFAIHGCALPCSLAIGHPRFHDLEVVVTGADEGGLEIALAAKQQVYEHVDVTASRGGATFAPESVASTVIKTEDKAAAPATLLELVEGVAGVAENGQGGIFQVFSIRGVSRHRVLTLVSGIPIIGARRAGVSTSFVDPTLIGSVDVLRGPASTYYGSGALGGVVQVFPRTFEGLHLDAGWDSFGDTRYLRVGWGRADGTPADGTNDDDDGGLWSLGLAFREAGNGEAVDGSELNSKFTQISGSLTRAWRAGGRDYEVQVLPTYGRDIGKSNSSFPNPTTDYPRENHLLLRFAVAGGRQGDSPWRASVYAHPNDVITTDFAAGESFAEVENRAFDFGADWQREWSRAGGEGRLSSLAGRYGIDYVGRRGVDADERQEDLAGGSVIRLQTLDGAEQDEAALFGSVRWSLGAATFQAGSRLTWQRQQNDGQSSREDSAITAFLGYVRPLGKGFEVAANAGTGLRFPNLSERFFSGTTGRGGVIGNPDLEPEGSLTFDLGLRWFGDRTFLSTQVFHQRIDDYVERVEIADDLLTFVNLTSGTIVGFEIEGFYKISEPWLLSWSGHLLDGEDDAGVPLADVPADRLQLGLTYERDAWRGKLRLQHRASKDDPGSGESPIPDAQLVSASVSYRLASGLAVTLQGRNLLDEAYFNSADRRSPLAPGRTFGVSLSWSGS